jgi:glycerol uptake facilitator-like aquaporin
LGQNSTLAPIPIGISIWLIDLVLIPWTGCGINPARTWGPAILCSFAGVDTWDTSGLLVYFLGPMLGSALTVMITHILWGGSTPPSERKPQHKAQVVDDDAA